MPASIQLKGNFDRLLRESYDALKSLKHRVELEWARPKMWTKEQIDFLDDLAQSVSRLHSAVTELAAQARDD